MTFWIISTIVWAALANLFLGIILGQNFGHKFSREVRGLIDRLDEGASEG